MHPLPIPPTDPTPESSQSHRRSFRFPFLILFLLISRAAAQTGALDSSFNNGPVGVSILQLVLQSDGQILAGGAFTSWGATSISNLVRLNPNGTLDSSLATPPMTQFDGAFNGRVNTLAAQPDDKILVGGSFDSVGGVARTNLCRLNASGSLDAAFAVQAEGGIVWKLARQSDGSTLVGGAFTRINGVTRPGFARIDASGAFDSSFAPNIAPFAGANVSAIAVLPDGKILVGGSFGRFNSITFAFDYFGVLRLDANGTLDGTFAPPSLPAQLNRVISLVIQSDDRVIVAGNFASIGGVARQSIARLETNGAVDPTWPGPGVSGVNANSRAVNTMQALGSGQILIAGSFETYNGETTEGVARLNADGTRDTTFNSPVGTVFQAAALAVQADGGILLGGTFDVGPGTSLVRLAGGVTAPTLTYSLQPGGVLRFDVPAGFNLQKVLNLGDGWDDVTGSTTIDVPMTDPRGFFQLKQ